MNDLELIFNMLGERATAEITQVEDSKSVPKLKSDAKRGGDVAGNARKQLESEIKKPIISSKNYLHEPENQKRIKTKK